jgi:hypothetical protein
MQAKFWLTPSVTLAHAVGFSAVELRRLQHITQENRQKLIEAWDEFFSE